MLAFQRIRLINIRRAGVFGEYTLANVQAVFTSAGFWSSLWTTLVYTIGATFLLDRVRPGRRAGAARPVPRAHLRPRLGAAAVRRAGRGRDVRVGDAAEPAVRHRQRLGPAVPRLGPADRVPQPARVHDLALRLAVRRPARPADRDRVRGVALLPVRVPVPARPAPGGAGASWRRRRWSTARRRPRASGTSCCRSSAPVIALLCVLRFIMTFNKFDDVYLLTGGGAGTEVVSVRVYQLPHRPLRHRRRRGAGARARRRPDHRCSSSTCASWRPAVEGRGLMDRATVETRVFRRAALGRHRGAGRGDAVPLLLHGAAVGAADRGGAGQPRADLGAAGGVDRSTRTRRCSPRPATAGRDSCKFLLNSAIVSIAATVLTLLVSIPGAYAVSRLRFVGRRQVHFLFLSVYLFPAILLAIPLFVLFTRLGLRGSLFGLTIVYIAQTVPVSIYMLRNYLSTIPVSLEEAAAVDGVHPPADDPQGGPAAGRARRHGERALRVHDRLERVPLRAALPGRGPGRLDGLARAWRSSPAASRSARRC